MTQTGMSAPGATGDQSKADAAKEGAKQTAQDLQQEASDTVADVRHEAAHQVGELKDRARSQADEVVGRAREQVGTQADGATRQMAEAMTAAGSELRSMADRSEQQDGPMTALVRQVGERASEMADRYQEGGYRSLARDLSGFARSSPGVFLLAAAGAGFAVGRIVKNADTKAILDAGRHSDSGTGDGSPELRTGGPEALPGTPIGITGGESAIASPVGATGVDLDPGGPQLGGLS